MVEKGGTGQGIQILLSLLLLMAEINGQNSIIYYSRSLLVMHKYRCTEYFLHTTHKGANVYLRIFLLLLSTAATLL